MKFFLLILFCVQVLTQEQPRSLLQIDNDQDRLKLQSLFQKYLSVEEKDKLKSHRFQTFVDYMYSNNLIDKTIKQKAVKVFKKKQKYLEKSIIRKLLLKKLELNVPQYKNLPINHFNLDNQKWNAYYNDQVIGDNFHQFIFCINKFKNYRKRNELRFDRFLVNFDKYLKNLTNLSFINSEQHDILITFTNDHLEELKKTNPFLDPDHFLLLLKRNLAGYGRQRKMVFELLDYNYNDIKNDKIEEIKNKIENQNKSQKRLKRYGFDYLNQYLKQLEDMSVKARKSRKLINKIQRSLILRLSSRNLVKTSFKDFINKFNIKNKKKQQKTLQQYLNKLVKLKIFEKKPKLLESILKYQINNRKLIQGPEIILDDRYKQSLQFRHFMYSFLFVSKQFFSIYMHKPNVFWYKFLEKMPNLQNAGAMGFFMRTFLSIFGKSLKVASYKNLQTIVHKYADALEFADLVNSQEKIVFAKVFTRFLHKQLKFGGKIDLQESFEKLHDNAGKQIIEHFKANNYRKISKHLFNKFNYDLNKVFSRHIDYNIAHLPFHKVAKSYIKENYKLQGKSLNKAVFALEKTKLAFFPSMLRRNIIGLVLKTKYGFLLRHKKVKIHKIFSGYRDKVVRLKKVSKIQYYQNLKNQFLKLQRLDNEKLVLQRFKQSASLTPQKVKWIGNFYSHGFKNYYFNNKQEFNDFFSRYLDYFVKSHILKFEHKIQFQQLVENTKCFDNHNYNFNELYKKLELKKRVDKQEGLQYKKQIRKIMHPLYYKSKKHINSILAKFKLKTQEFFDKDKINYQRTISKALYDKSPNDYIFDARQKLLKKTMYKMVAHLTENKKIYEKNQKKDLRKKDIQNILSLNGNKNLMKMFFKSKAFNGVHQYQHIKSTIAALKQINKVQNKEIRKMLFKKYLLSRNKQLEYEYTKKLVPKDIYSKNFSKDQLLKIYKYKYDLKTASKMLEFIKSHPDPLISQQLSHLKLPEMNSYTQKVKFANLFKVILRKLYYQKVFKKVFGTKFSKEYDMLKFYYSKKEKLKKVEKLFNNQILKLFTNESEYKQDLDQSLNVFKKVVMDFRPPGSKRVTYTDGLFEFYSEILKNKQNWKIRDQGDFGKIKILMKIPEQGVKTIKKPPKEDEPEPDEFLILCCLCADCTDQEELLDNDNLQFLRVADQMVNIHPTFRINLFLQKQGKIVQQPEIEKEINQKIMEQKQALEEAEQKLNVDQVQQTAIEQDLSENQAKDFIIEENIDNILDQNTLEKDILKVKKQNKEKIQNEQGNRNNQVIQDIPDNDDYNTINKDDIEDLKKNIKQNPTQINIDSFQSVEDFIPDQLDYTKPDTDLQNQVKQLPKQDNNNFKQNTFNIDFDVEPNQELNEEILKQAKNAKIPNKIESQNVNLDNLDYDSMNINQKQLVNQFQQLNNSLNQLKNSKQEQNTELNQDFQTLLGKQTQNVQKKVYIENVPENLEVPNLDSIYQPMTLKIIKKSLI